MKTDPVGSQASDWDNEADIYEDSRQTDPVYRSCVWQVTKRIPYGTSLCLDAGCGTGMATIDFAKNAKSVIAVDYSLESLKILKSKGGVNVFPVQADISALPFIDSAFNFSACINTLQHFRPGSSQEKAVAELRRVTKKNCGILVSVHHFSREKKHAGWVKEGKPGQKGIEYIFRFEKKDLLKLMPNASVVAVGYYGLDDVKYIGGRIQNFVANIFGRMAAAFGIGHMLIGVEKKDKTDTGVQ